MTDHSIQTYVSDMLALERHVAKPIAAQVQDKDFSDSATASLLHRINQLNDTHISELETCLNDVGGHAAAPVKEAVSQVEGFVASAIDMMRKTKVSKALRDDYTALALCTAGYTMLQATAIALHESRVADLAQRHLRDYAQCVMSIGQALPGIVIAELRDIGVEVDTSMTEPAQRAAEQAWRSSGSQSSTTSTTGTVENRSTQNTTL